MDAQRKDAIVKALKVFKSKHKSIVVRVRLLPNLDSVKCEYKMNKASRKTVSFSSGEVPSAFFYPTTSKRAKYTGTIVVPLVCPYLLLKYVSHEVTHAVMNHLQNVDCDGDEKLAYPVGELTANICRVITEFNAKGVYS